MRTACSSHQCSNSSRQIPRVSPNQDGDRRPRLPAPAPQSAPPRPPPRPPRRGSRAATARRAPAPRRRYTEADSSSAGNTRGRTALRLLAVHRIVRRIDIQHDARRRRRVRLDEHVYQQGVEPRLVIGHLLDTGQPRRPSTRPVPAGSACSSPPARPRDPPPHPVARRVHTLPTAAATSGSRRRVIMVVQILRVAQR